MNIKRTKRNAIQNAAKEAARLRGPLPKSKEYLVSQRKMRDDRVRYQASNFAPDLLDLDVDENEPL